MREILNAYAVNGIIVSQQGSGRYAQFPDLGVQIKNIWAPFIKCRPSLLLDFFEIRTMGTDIARGIWVYHKGNTIIMLRVFIKKSQKTPAKEIDLAKKRLAEVLNETGKP